MQNDVLLNNVNVKKKIIPFYSEAATRGVLKEISQYSQQSTCVESIRLHVFVSAALLKIDS